MPGKIVWSSKEVPAPIKEAIEAVESFDKQEFKRRLVSSLVSNGYDVTLTTRIQLTAQRQGVVDLQVIDPDTDEVTDILLVRNQPTLKAQAKAQVSTSNRVIMVARSL